eukprot:CAMPEP_0172544302 /NCGR_PEP_ID=MMETSP1067-20121228/14491_1 /TAXON_ID=265564 ORGANISM="Thalassiosira punctigera, Strain Tpunct2005C2" /NCGR_SAMPLE_ID=MMETSP1067 /ASSEMBLY_ACC=CAM_ASM_000444 /LENGTH=65 /DNA_ID=CAMNT_0013330837 /DNA_START=71 /DNA_END=265 /DNA_ORIENTATION=+
MVEPGGPGSTGERKKREAGRPVRILWEPSRPPPPRAPLARTPSTRREGAQNTGGADDPREFDATL